MALICLKVDLFFFLILVKLYNSEQILELWITEKNSEQLVELCITGKTWNNWEKLKQLV